MDTSSSVSRNLGQFGKGMAQGVCINTCYPKVGKLIGLVECLEL